MGEWNDYLKFGIGLFAIVDPVGVVPIFINMTSHYTRTQREKTAWLAALTVCGLLIGALIMGEALLNFFGITIASFRVAGGILILLIALSMVQARISPVKQTQEEATDAEEREAIAIVPLGTPLLAGPGAISTVIIYAHRDQTVQHHLMLAGIIFIIGLSTWASFKVAEPISRLLGKTGINIVLRLMGLVMAAIGVEFIANGLKELFPRLA
ncbi:MAG: YchE family NAAT transporter [SAR324 cluster bacterium]|nr:YchE family NAAT transporter [SAR324 cluster bacterium]MBF0352599.1 YchE family NAAT transporter [SAR324 cluster bacterium]